LPRSHGSPAREPSLGLGSPRRALGLERFRQRARQAFQDDPDIIFRDLMPPIATRSMVCESERFHGTPHNHARERPCRPISPGVYPLEATRGERFAMQTDRSRPGSLRWIVGALCLEIALGIAWCAVVSPRDPAALAAVTILLTSLGRTKRPRSSSSVRTPAISAVRIRGTSKPRYGSVPVLALERARRGTARTGKCLDRDLRSTNRPLVAPSGRSSDH
jgi:hypothetical protein